MRFVCNQCQTKYTIDDARVRGKVLKIRCKTCQNVITVREPTPAAVAKVDKPTAAAQAAAAAPARPLAKALDQSFGGSLGDDFGESSERTMISSGPGAVGAAIDAAAVAASVAARSAAANAEWFVSLDGEQEGPFTVEKAAERARQGETLGKEVFCWRDGFDGWVPPLEVPELAKVLAAAKSAPRPIHAASPASPPPTAASAPVTAHPARIEPKHDAPAPAPMAAMGRAGGAAPALAAQASPVAAVPIAAPKLHSIAPEPVAPPQAAKTPAPVVKPAAVPAPVEAKAPSGPARPGAGPVAPPLPVAAASSAPIASPPVAARSGPPVAAAPAPTAPLPTPTPAAPLPTPTPALKSSPTLSPPGADGHALAAAKPAANGPTAAAGPSGNSGKNEAPPPAADKPAEAKQPAPPNLDLFIGEPSVIGHLPLPSSPVLAPPPVVIVAPGSAQGAGWMKWFAVGALVVIVALLGTVGYLLVGRKSGPVAQPTPAPTTVPESNGKPIDDSPVALSDGTPAHAPGQPAAAAGATDKKGPVATQAAKQHHPGATPGSKAAGPNTQLTDEQRRLQELYGGAGGDVKQEHGVPTAPKAEEHHQANFGQQDILDVMRKNKQSLTTCYERALKRAGDSLQKARVEVEVKVGISGTVTHVQVNGEYATQDIGTCLTQAIKHWHFPATGDEYETAFPILLQATN